MLESYDNVLSIRIDKTSFTIVYIRIYTVYMRKTHFVLITLGIKITIIIRIVLYFFVMCIDKFCIINPIIFQDFIQKITHFGLKNYTFFVSGDKNDLKLDDRREGCPSRPP